MGVFTVVMMVLSTLVVLGTWLFLKKQDGKSLNASLNLPLKKKENLSLKDILEIQDIQKGIIILPNDTYCAICSLSSPDFYLLGEVGQENVEDGAAGVLMQLNYPVQLITTAESLDTRSAVQEITDNIENLSPLLQDLASARAEYLEILMRDRAVSAKQAYIVLPFVTTKGFNNAYAELQARIASVTGVFAGAKVSISPLKDAAILDLVSHLLNRNRLFRPSEALADGVITPFHLSEGQVP